MGIDWEEIMGGTPFEIDMTYEEYEEYQNDYGNYSDYDDCDEYEYDDYDEEDNEYDDYDEEVIEYVEEDTEENAEVIVCDSDALTAAPKSPSEDVGNDVFEGLSGVFSDLDDVIYDSDLPF